MTMRYVPALTISTGSLSIRVRVILISSDDAFKVTGTKICDLEYRVVRGANVWVAKHEDVCRLDILMESVNVRQ